MLKAFCPAGKTVSAATVRGGGESKGELGSFGFSFLCVCISVYGSKNLRACD